MAKTKLGHRITGTLLPLVLWAGSAAGLAGCRVDENSVKRWGLTEHGPEKLVAVITHEKYAWPLRVDAGLELLRMKPRNGRRIGINKLVDALSVMSVEDRRTFLKEFLPGLLAGIKQVRTKNEGADPSTAFKDGAMAIMTHDKPSLFSDEAARKQVTEALIEWMHHDFERRLDDTTQMFGMEQMVRTIGAPAVKAFPALISPEAMKFDRVAALVAEFGDQATKDATGQKLVELAKFVNSQAWLDKNKTVLEEANKASKLAPTPEQFKAQLKQYQDEALTKVFAALKRVGTRAAVDYCLSIALDGAQDAKRRVAALAAIEGRLDKNNAGDLEKILDLAGKDDTPDDVRDLAFERIGEMPRDKVVGRLYGFFGAKKWKVRWVAAETVLKMSSVENLGEFMSKLPGGPATGFSIAEPLRYGEGIEKLTPGKDGKKPRDAVVAFLDAKGASLAARLTALGYFYAHGVTKDLSLVETLGSDKTPTPKVDDPEAKWHCEVAKPDGKETELKDIKTVGEFVTYCVAPAVKGR